MQGQHMYNCIYTYMIQYNNNCIGFIYIYNIDVCEHAMIPQWI